VAIIGPAVSGSVEGTWLASHTTIQGAKDRHSEALRDRPRCPTKLVGVTRIAKPIAAADDAQKQFVLRAGRACGALLFGVIQGTAHGATGRRAQSVAEPSLLVLFFLGVPPPEAA